MIIVLISFLAGILTVLAPCVFPLLPIIIGGSSSSSRKISPYIIITSLVASVVLFTLLLRATTALLFIDPAVWNWISGTIIILLGLSLVFPDVWTSISTKIGFNTASDKLLEKGEGGGIAGDIITGVALGPVFTSCSPTYAYIIAVVLPGNIAFGLVNLLSYALGLGIVLLAVSILGQNAIKRLKWASNPYSLFKQVLGGLFIIVGVAIIAGWLKILETWSAELLADSIIQWEIQLRERFE